MLRRLSLMLDLLPSPSCSLNCSRGEFAAGSGIFDESRHPVLSVKLSDFSTREGLGQVTKIKSASCQVYYLVLLTQ